MKKIIYLLMSLSFVAFASCEDKDSPSDGNGSISENSSSVSYSSGTENGHEYVDLGLASGTLWATCNIGAANPQDYGDYYAWGETTTKEEYSWNTYKYGKASNRLTKYCDDSKYGEDGFTDNKTTLELSDDAAYMNWGGKWRMPSLEQQNDLRYECYWVWTENYNGSGVKGYIVYKAKSSSDKGKMIYKNETPSSSYTLSDVHIFLPAAGCTDLRLFVGVNGYYWGSSLYGSNVGWSLDFTPEYIQGMQRRRFAGRSIRAVISKDGRRYDDVICTDSNGNTSAVSVYKSGTEDGHDYVDLGLTSGTLWATANIGAKTPQDNGNYYAWGETTQKSIYNWDTYKYASGFNFTLTKYCDISKCGKDGFTDNKTTLDIEDDAAYVNWGGNWRMPTKAQQKELWSECYWVWTENYNGSGVKGYIVYKAKSESDKGKYIPLGITPSSSYTLSDAHIFLPAGCGGDLSSFGQYWSSSMLTGCFCASAISFTSNGVGIDYEYRCVKNREYALPVRAVIPR